MMMQFNKIALSMLALLLSLTGCGKGSYLNMMQGEDVAKTAESYIGSTDWAKDAAKYPDDSKNKQFPFREGSWKCNLFVNDVLYNSGIQPPKTIGGWPEVAADWANSGHNIPNWKHMGYGVPRERGDVIAKKSTSANATGHCGIAVSSSEVVAAGRDEVSKGDHELKGGAVRRYTGQ